MNVGRERTGQEADGRATRPGTNTAATLGLWDAVSLIIGIVVGVSIYAVPSDVMRGAGSPWVGLAVWAVCGVLTLAGAFCYAELAGAYPGDGGDYDYLNRAFGRWAGFFFGWAQLTVIRTSNIGNMAIVFAAYALSFTAPDTDPRSWHGAGFALAAIIGLSTLNALGVVFGKTAQNILTAAKITGLAGIVVAGLGWGEFARWQSVSPPAGHGNGTEVAVWDWLQSLALPMILVLYAFGGWNDAVLVAAEVRDRRRNLPLALLLGTSGIILVYLLINLAFLSGLGFDGVVRSKAVAADVLALPLGAHGARVMAVLVMLSALGATNGLIFTGGPVYTQMARDYRLFARLGFSGERKPVEGEGGPDAPAAPAVLAIALQAAISCGMIVVVATPDGQQAINGVLATLGFPRVDWASLPSPFEALVFAAAPVFWLFFCLTGLSVFVLRCTDRGTERPFRVPVYPLTPAVFCLTCLAMTYSAVKWAGPLTLLGFVPLALGIPVYLAAKHASGRGG